MTALLLVGTGLIGGSFALAARAAGLFDRIDGVDANPTALRHARDLGIVDPPSDAVTPEAVCVATPVSSVANCVARMARRHPDAAVFDVGSVKGSVIDALRARGALPANYVPCHPVAGSEKSGAGAARADLFAGRTVIVTPTAETDPSATSRVAGWWRAVGAVVTEQTPERHDCLLAATSHLPHLVAFALMEMVGEIDEATLQACLGGGFRDFSRIAAADAAVWADILHENRDAVGRWAQTLAARLAVDEDKAALARRIDQARALRLRLDD